MPIAPILTSDEVATLRALGDRLQADRPPAKGRQMLVHFAVEDLVSGIIAAGQGNLSCERDIRAAADGVRKAVMASD